MALKRLTQAQRAGRGTAKGMWGASREFEGKRIRTEAAAREPGEGSRVASIHPGDGPRAELVERGKEARETASDERGEALPRAERRPPPKLPASKVC